LSDSFTGDLAFTGHLAITILIARSPMKES
jgi:hypothetical protein